MTEDPLSVDQVDIVRAPGYESGGFPIDDLCPGINIIHGPNASGKTTLARSIRWLLWPDTASDRASINGQLSLDGQRWRVDVDRGRANYQQNGQEANRPSLPSSDQQDRYVLSLHELLQHETRDESFAEAIKRESAGGYDLSAAADDLDFDDSPTTRRKSEVKEAEAAVEALRAAEREIEELREEQHRLPSLRAELEDVKRAQDRVMLLEQAIDFANARDELEAAEGDLEEFPEILDRIEGDEADTVAELESRIEDWEEKRAEADEKLAEAEKQLDEADLPEGGLPGGLIDRLKQQRDTLKSLEDKKRDHERNLTGFERRRSKASEDIPLDIDGEDLASLDPGSWEHISEFAKLAERVRAERTTRATVENWLTPEEGSEEDESALRRGSQALEGWLANPPGEPSEDGEPTFRVAVVSAAVITAMGIALATLVNPAGLLSLVVAAGILWYGHRARSAPEDSERTRQTHRETFRQVGLTPPEEWSEDGVRDRLVELYDAIAEQRLAEERINQREALTADHTDLEEREAELEEERNDLRDRLGAAPETDDFELVVTAKAILRWQEAHDQVIEQKAEIGEIEGQIAEQRTELEAELEPYGYAEVDDAASATQLIRNLESRGAAYDEATRTIADAKETIDEAGTKLDGLRAQRDEVFTDVGLDPDEGDRLRSLCEQADAYAAAKKTREQARLLAENEAEDLEEMPGFEPELKERSVSELRRDKRDAEETASSYDEIHGTINKIEQRIDDAKRDSQLEESIAEKERALDALSDQLDEDYASMVGNVLAEHVREATSESNRPAVFKHAREVLARISKGRYRLDIDESEATFRAYDTVKERGFALDELSSATRLQVLLAVRIAFVEQQEHGNPLPLLLDETLANSDDGKAEIIIESMLELAREGRQVFYFTAQGDEVAKWLIALEEIDDVDHTVIDLADIRELDRHVDVPDLHDIVESPVSVPAPEDHDHASYGEALDVPPFYPRRGAGSVHLWYVVDDLDLLHHLLELGIEHWGQFENLLASGSGEFITDDPDVLDDVECKGRAVEEFIRSWEKGRGKRVDREALESSGAVSGNFIEDVTQLADELDGEAEHIIEALRNGQVNRFRSGKTDELEAYFKDNGYIDPLDTLEPELIRARVIECLVDNGIPRDQAREQGQELLARLGSSDVAPAR